MKKSDQIETTAVALAVNENTLLSEETSKQYYSLQPTTQKEAVDLYNAINNPTARIADMINMEIEIEHILIETVELANERTGEVEEVPRTVFIEPSGKSYVAVSYGIFNSTKRIVKMFGEPQTWEKPLKVMVKQIKKGENSILTLNVVM